MHNVRLDGVSVHNVRLDGVSVHNVRLDIVSGGQSYSYKVTPLPN